MQLILYLQLLSLLKFQIMPFTAIYTLKT